MKPIEYFRGPNGVIMVRLGDTVQTIAPEDKDIINELLDKIENDYPEAWQRLFDLYGGKYQYKWFMFRRFISCNFGDLDNIPDRDENNYFNFEHVPCPMRGECADENIICHPKFSTDLTKRERQVLALICENKTDVEIADILYRSPNTIKIHRSNILRKLNVANKTELREYARKNNMHPNNSK